MLEQYHALDLDLDLDLDLHRRRAAIAVALAARGITDRGTAGRNAAWQRRIDALHPAIAKPSYRGSRRPNAGCTTCPLSCM
jgi:hypothetical protein